MPDVQLNRLMIGSYVIHKKDCQLSKVIALNSADMFPVTILPEKGEIYHCKPEALQSVEITKEIFSRFSGDWDSYEGFEYVRGPNFENGSGVKNYNNGMQFSVLHTFQMYLMGAFAISIELRK